MPLSKAEIAARWRKNHPEKAKAQQEARYSSDEYRAYMRERMRKYRAENPDKNRDYCRKYRAKNPDREKGYQLKLKYGMTLEQRDALAEAQGHKCLICTEEKPLVVDHCHGTGRVRGLLCHQCNLVIRRGRDTPEFFRKVIDYLQR